MCMYVYTQMPTIVNRTWINVLDVINYSQSCVHKTEVNNGLLSVTVELGSHTVYYI